jgi:hypothetical protein
LTIIGAVAARKLVLSVLFIGTFVKINGRSVHTKNPQ